MAKGGTMILCSLLLLLGLAASMPSRQFRKNPRKYWLTPAERRLIIKQFENDFDSLVGSQDHKPGMEDLPQEDLVIPDDGSFDHSFEQELFSGIQGGEDHPPSDFQPPHQDDTYLPPHQDDTYLPPHQDDEYLPPHQDGEHLPPHHDDTYLPPHQDDTYLPPPHDGGYLPPHDDHIPPHAGHEAYRPPHSNHRPAKPKSAGLFSHTQSFFINNKDFKFAKPKNWNRK